MTPALDMLGYMGEVLQLLYRHLTCSQFVVSRVLYRFSRKHTKSSSPHPYGPIHHQAYTMDTYHIQCACTFSCAFLKAENFWLERPTSLSDFPQILQRPMLVAPD
jgi:hypothetical protein